MSRAIVLSTSNLATLILASLSLGYLLGSWGRIGSSYGSHSLNSSSGATHANTVNGAFVLLVTMKFTSIENRDTFLEWIEPVCNDVYDNEGPGSITDGSSSLNTLSYKVAISDKDPLSVVLLERYADKDHGYLEVHKSGTEFMNFREKLKGMQESGDVVIEGESYLETDLGFV